MTSRSATCEASRVSRASAARSFVTRIASSELLEREGVDDSELLFEQIAPSLHEAIDLAPDGGLGEVDGSVLPEAFPEERGAIRVVELASLTDPHSPCDRRERERNAAAWGRREVIEVGQEVREPRSADPREAALAERSVQVAEHDVRDALVDARTNIPRRDIQKTR
jgi:hypothetical protein